MKLKHHRTTIAAPVAVLVASIVVLAACAPTAPSQAPVVVESTQVEAAAATLRMSFIVNFRPSHALGRAQSLQSAGRYNEAERLVSVTLRDNVALRGLCFERFTVGGAEIVLNVCAPSPWEDALVTQTRWLEQVGATPGVGDVELILVAQRDNVAANPS
jgi:hypothetical protein